MGWLSFVVIVIPFLIVFLIGKSNLLDIYNTTIGEDIGFTLLWALVSGLTGILVWLLVTLFSMPNTYDCPYTILFDHSEELVQAQVGDKTEGYCGIFYGRIDNKDVYRFYTKDSDNGYELNYIYANNSKIIETNNVSPCVLIYDRIRYDIKSNWWRRNFFSEKAWEDLCTDEPEHMGVLYVPEGTLTNLKFDNLNL